MSIARVDLDRVRDSRHEHRRAAIQERPVAQLPAGIVTPAHDAPRREHRTGVDATCRDLHGIREGRHHARCRARSARSVAQLPVEIETPTQHAPPRRERACVSFVARVDLDDARERGPLWDGGVAPERRLPVGTRVAPRGDTTRRADRQDETVSAVERDHWARIADARRHESAGVGECRCGLNQRRDATMAFS